MSEITKDIMDLQDAQNTSYSGTWKDIAEQLADALLSVINSYEGDDRVCGELYTKEGWDALAAYRKAKGE